MSKHLLRNLSMTAFLLFAFHPAAKAQSDSAKQPAELKVFDPALVDHAVDPCENFYRYSCNGWFARNPLPADQESYGRFTELAELNLRNLRQILETAAKPSPNRSAIDQKIGDEYQACLDAPAINQQGLKPLQPELDRIAKLNSSSELPGLLAHLHQIGVSAFFSFDSQPDFDNASLVIANFGAHGLGLPERDYYLRDDAKSKEQRRQYVAHVAKMLQLSGETEAAAKKDAELVLALETRLAKATLPITERRNPQNLNHPTDLAKLTAALPHFSLASYLEATGITLSGKINNSQPKFLTEFDAIAASTPASTLRVYLRWHLLHAYAGTSLPESFDKENWNFYAHTLNGAEKQQDRWKRCTRRVDEELGEALGQAFVARYFPPADKERAKVMTDKIEQTMEKDIDSLDWMSPETKTRAKEKLHGVLNKIGYPDHWRDYTALEIRPGDALGNEERANVFESARDLAKIGKPVDKTEWVMTPPTVNAYYDPQGNNVNFPAGYFQPPFYSGKEDDAANYGDMGSTIGHELTHGFDDEGRQFDKDGNLRDWWSKEDGKKFTDKAQCMVDQYNAIESVPGVHLNGELTLGENLADLGGLWLAWLAWKDVAEVNHVDMTAKTDGYTPDQRFWIAYAQQWCTQTRQESLRAHARTDPHAPDEYRTNTILQDLPDFARSFQCKPGSKMVISKACRIW